MLYVIFKSQVIQTIQNTEQVYQAEQNSVIECVHTQDGKIREGLKKNGLCAVWVNLIWKAGHGVIKCKVIRTHGRNGKLMKEQTRKMPKQGSIVWMVDVNNDIVECSRSRLHVRTSYAARSEHSNNNNLYLFHLPSSIVPCLKIETS